MTITLGAWRAQAPSRLRRRLEAFVAAAINVALADKRDADRLLAMLDDDHWLASRMGIDVGEAAAVRVVIIGEFRRQLQQRLALVRETAGTA